MGRFAKKSQEYKIKQELLVVFHEQERMTVDEMVEEYYEPHTRYQFLVAKTKLKTILGSIKRDLAKERIPFGCLNESCEYGMPLSKEEFEYMGIMRYKLVKGIVRGSELIMNIGVKRGLIKVKTRSELIAVPLLEAKNKKGK